jgi:hypothetical protein
MIERLWTEETTASLNVLSGYVAARGYPASRQRFDPRASKYESGAIASASWPCF